MGRGSGAAGHGAARRQRQGRDSGAAGARRARQRLHAAHRGARHRCQQPRSERQGGGPCDVWRLPDRLERRRLRAATRRHRHADGSRGGLRWAIRRRAARIAIAVGRRQPNANWDSAEGVHGGAARQRSRPTRTAARRGRSRCRARRATIGFARAPTPTDGWCATTASSGCRARISRRPRTTTAASDIWSSSPTRRRVNAGETCALPRPRRRVRRRRPGHEGGAGRLLVSRRPRAGQRDVRGADRRRGRRRHLGEHRVPDEGSALSGGAPGQGAGDVAAAAGDR